MLGWLWRLRGRRRGLMRSGCDGGGDWCRGGARRWRWICFGGGSTDRTQVGKLGSSPRRLQGVRGRCGDRDPSVISHHPRAKAAMTQAFLPIMSPSRLESRGSSRALACKGPGPGPAGEGHSETRRRIVWSRLILLARYQCLQSAEPLVAAPHH